VGSYAYFQKQIVPLEEAKVSIMTHAFNYGTGCFEGIRGNWNAEHEQIYIFRLREHYERLKRSAQILRIDIDESVDELCDITADVVRRCGFAQDVYIRPLAYKSAEVINLRITGIPSDVAIFVAPFPNYLPGEGVRCGTSSWRRVHDTAIPGRAKVTGIYINSALANAEVVENGYDEAILLTHEGNVSEGPGENIFLLSNGQLVTPSPAEGILMGITRSTVMELAREELGIQTIERQVPRSELYSCEECFMTGTAAHLTPVLEIDHRVIGDGHPGPITHRLQNLYLDVIRGKNERYRDWCTAVSPAVVEA
jgi:branched-chain amino acid aminotransferase